MSRVPTEKQYGILLMLGSGAALVVGRKREVAPLLRREWVTGELHKDGSCYFWVRITPTGLRALADAVERYGLPEFKGAAGLPVEEGDNHDG